MIDTVHSREGTRITLRKRKQKQKQSPVREQGANAEKVLGNNIPQYRGFPYFRVLHLQLLTVLQGNLENLGQVNRRCKSMLEPFLSKTDDYESYDLSFRSNPKILSKLLAKPSNIWWFAVWWYRYSNYQDALQEQFIENRVFDQHQTHQRDTEAFLLGLFTLSGFELQKILYHSAPKNHYLLNDILRSFLEGFLGSPFAKGQPHVILQQLMSTKSK